MLTCRAGKLAVHDNSATPTNSMLTCSAGKLAVHDASAIPTNKIAAQGGSFANMDLVEQSLLLQAPRR